MIKVIDFADRYKDKPYTYDQIIEYIKNNAPYGPYKGVVQTFLSRGEEGTTENREFYRWVLQNCESIISLQPLRDKLDFENFLFCLGNLENPYYNQKWHFFVSYLVFNEYYAKKEMKSLFRYLNGDWYIEREPSWFQCRELDIWFRPEKYLL